MYFLKGTRNSRSRPHLTNIDNVSSCLSCVLEKRHEAISDLEPTETKFGLPKQKLPNVVHGVHCNQNFFNDGQPKQIMDGRYKGVKSC